MSILVVGSVAFDSVQTPFGRVEEVLGGSGTYFSTSASFFADINLVAVVGEDFPQRHLDFLRARNVNLEGVKVVPGETFRWKGEYGYDLNEAKTLDTRLNVFENFKPILPESYRDADFVFLGNIDPELQSQVLDQVRHPELVVCDTMNFWISGRREALLKTLTRVDILMINEAEARQLAEEANLVKAAQSILSMGPKTVVIKRGEYGALMFSEHTIFAAPAYPLETVFDPTGAGDTFAGGFMGYLAANRNFGDGSIRQAIIFGSVMASFVVENFSLDRLRDLEYRDIEERFRRFKLLTEFEGL
ncbi:sugar kinase [Geothermobacter hydrogeniphilus]|uniref:Sugar kinase n=1 Tax=Geothermobacter hydrogeniphilus TaxID=1969733 RepID=A0A1X0Y357_9BACT|nr:PfkB family carbohydrate kinase [Geothermobacter hydrogeniphilus]ORJ59593.1 sugar kinase [Geothermobacter hydrogeniphilus]PNU19620.1 sugar kinase [Geothermobacter hydrogeniphilus]